MRILVTGKDGQVGGELSRRSWQNAELIFVGRQACDLSDRQAIRDLVRHVSPQVIVNTAAYTAVDKAEAEQELCFAINGVAPGVFAEEAARLNALLIHYSTDYVFSGQKAEPYVEDDPIQPLSVYGASKAAGEAAIAKAASRYLLLRTTWVYDARGKNFLRTMLRLAPEKSELRVVDDQYGAPTSARAIAAATARLVERYACVKDGFPSGLYHMTAAGSTSWCGFAREIFSGSTIDPKPKVVAIPTAEYPTPAKRPRNSVLSNEKFEHAFGFRLNSWQEQLEDVLSAIQPSAENHGVDGGRESPTPL